MLKNKLYENLDGYQLRILEGALNGTALEDADVNEVYSTVQEHEYETHMECGAVLNEEAQENFNEVYRYFNSQEDEEIRKEKFEHYVQKEYKELQATIDKYIEEGNLTPQQIYEYGVGTENCMLNHAEIKFGFKGCDINLELNFHGIDELIEENILELEVAE